MYTIRDLTYLAELSRQNAHRLVRDWDLGRLEGRRLVLTEAEKNQFLDNLEANVKGLPDKHPRVYHGIGRQFLEPREWDLIRWTDYLLRCDWREIGEAA